METQYINLNMTPVGVTPTFHISQYDVGRTLGFIVYSGGVTVDLDTYTCTVEATRSDGTAITSAVATTDNIGTFEVTPTMSNKADKYRCQLIIVDANSKRIASLPFDMEVTKAAMDENSEAIEEDASLYQQYTEAVQGAITEANADIQAEENARIAAVSAEATTRASADSNLQSQINQIIAPSGEAPSAAEVQNARIGADGVTYSTLGDAIRGQVSDLMYDIDPLVPQNIVDLSDTKEVSNGASYVFNNHIGTLLPVNAWGWLNVSFLFNVDSDSDYYVHSNIVFSNGSNQNAIITYLDASNNSLGQVLITNSVLIHTPTTCTKIRINVYLSRDNEASMSDSVVINELSLTKREYAKNVINKLNKKKYIFIGDSYGVGYNPDDAEQKSWCELVKEYCGLTEKVDVFTFAASGYGFANSNGQFIKLLRQAELSISDRLAITDILVLGGINDATVVTDSQCRTEIHNFCVEVASAFPNAKVHVGMVSGSRTIAIKNDLPRVINNYQYAAFQTNGCYIDNIQYALCDKRLLSSDGTHPSRAGYAFISRHIANYIKNGNITISRPRETIGLEIGNIDWQQQNELETIYHNVSFAPTSTTMQSNTWYVLSTGLGVITPFNGYGETLLIGTILIHCDDNDGNPTILERHLQIRFTNYNYEYRIIYANGASETYNNVTQIDIQIGYMMFPSLQM